MTTIAGIWQQLVGGWLKPAAAFVVGLAANYWAGCPENLQGLFYFAGFVFVADIVFGTGRAVIKRELSSDAAGRGILKLIAYGSALLVAIGVDRHLGPAVGLEIGYTLEYTLLLLIVLQEGISLVEHLAEAGVPCQGILQVLKQYQEQAQDEDE